MLAACSAAPTRPGGGAPQLPPAAPGRFAARAVHCDAAALCVGADQRYPTLAAALAAARRGALIEVAAGTYRESDAITVAGVTIRGIAGRPHFDCTGLPLAADKACLYVAATGVTLDNLEISGAVKPDQDGGNGACLRNARGIDLRLRRIACHGSQEGLLSDGGRVVIAGSQFYDNGWNALTHNVYLSGRCVAAVVRGSVFRDARVGHQFKSRCPRNDIAYSLFRSATGSRDIDLPDGGDTRIDRSTLIMMPGAENHELIGFAAESCRHPGVLVLRRVRIVNTASDASIRNFGRCAGDPIVLDGVTVEGLAVRQIGQIVQR